MPATSNILSLPRELRDTIYDHLVPEDPYYIITASGEPRLVIPDRVRGALTACRQLHDEVHETVLRHAEVAVCFGMGSVRVKERIGYVVPDVLAQRTRRLTVIVDLDAGAPATGLFDKVPEEEVIPLILAGIDETLRTNFPRLEKVDVQFWVDLSNPSPNSDVVASGELAKSLLKRGIARPEELWWGYMGGKLTDPVMLRKHLMSSHSQRSREKLVREWGPEGLFGSYRGVNAEEKHAGSLVESHLGRLGACLLT